MTRASSRASNSLNNARAFLTLGHGRKVPAQVREIAGTLERTRHLVDAAEACLSSRGVRRTRKRGRRSNPPSDCAKASIIVRPAHAGDRYRQITRREGTDRNAGSFETSGRRRDTATAAIIRSCSSGISRSRKYPQPADPREAA